jgi:hypothetical protein
MTMHGRTRKRTNGKSNAKCRSNLSKKKRTRSRATGGKKKRCPNGSRRDSTGKCVKKTVTTPPVIVPSPVYKQNKYTGEEDFDYKSENYGSAHGEWNSTGNITDSNGYGSSDDDRDYYAEKKRMAK